MRPGVPWSVKGIEPEAREAAKAAARRAGLTLGEWLNQTILDQDETAAGPAGPGRGAVGTGRAPSDLDRLADRLDHLSDRLDQMSDRDPAGTRMQPPRREPMQPRPARAGSAADSIADRLDRTDARISEMQNDLEGIAEIMQSGTAPGGDGAVAALERALFEVVDHIELTDQRNGEVLKTIQARLSDLAGRVQGDGSPDQSAAREAIMRLEARVGELASRVDARERQHVDHDHSALEQRLADLAAKVDRAHERSRSNPAVEALEARLNQVSSKLNVAERLMTPQTDFNQIKSEVGKLRDEIARAAREPTKPALVHAIESRLNSLTNELSAVKSTAATNDSVARIGERLESIVARLADGDADARIETVENRLGDIARRLEDAVHGSGPDPQIDALERRIAEVATRIETPGGDLDALPAIHELEARVNDIASRLGDAERHFSVLDSIESNLSQLFNTIDMSRQAAIDAAEQAAFNAAQKMAHSSGSGDIAAGDALAALERGLAEVKSQQTSVDRHNQETLEAIHDTLKRVIERLGNLESRTAVDAAPESAGAYGGPERDPLGPGDDNDHGFGDFRLPPLPELSVPDPLSSHGGRGDDPPAQSSEPLRAPRQTEEHQLDEESDPGSESTEFSRAYDAPAASHNEDFIAAARRAAQAANQASELQDRPQRGGDDANRGSGGRFKGRRRTLLFVAAALLIAAGALSMSGVISIEVNETPRPASSASLAEPGAGSDLLEGADEEVIEPATEAANFFEQTQVAEIEPEASSRTPGGGSTEFVVPDRSDAAGAPEDPPVTITIEPQNPPTSGETRLEPSRTASRGARATDGEAPAGAAGNDGSFEAEQIASLATAAEPSDSLLPTPSPAAAPVPGTLLEAAEAGDPRAQFEVAARFADGRAGSTDLAAAATWYQRASAQGLAPAQYRLGALYEKGQGVPLDKGAARIWYQRAAEQGNLKAMHNLAVLLAGGVTGGADYARAARWFLRAAELGLADSQYNLAVLHERGLGVEQDLGAAYKWFAIATAKGDEEAEKRMTALAAQLDAETLANARTAYQSWRAAPLDRAANVVDLPDQLGADTMTSTPEADTAVARAQQLLAELGYDPGPADGMMGPRTREAIVAFERERGLPETGIASQSVVEQLEAAVAG